MYKSHSKVALLAVICGAGLYRSQEDGSGTGDATAPATAAPAVIPAGPVPAAPSEHVTMQKRNFHFKKEKDVMSEDGKTVVEEGKKLPTAECYLPIPTPAYLAKILTAPADQFVKERELIMSVVADAVYSVARGQVNDFREKDPTAVVTNAALDYDRLDFTAIANTPKAERGAYVPGDEELKAFLEVYVGVMPAATDKPVENIKNHVPFYQSLFKKYRNQKQVLQLFANSLSVFVTSVEPDVLEEHQDVVEYFISKLDKWLKAEEKLDMDAL